MTEEYLERVLSEHHQGMLHPASPSAEGIITHFYSTHELYSCRDPIDSINTSFIWRKANFFLRKKCYQLLQSLNGKKIEPLYSMFMSKS